MCESVRVQIRHSSHGDHTKGDLVIEVSIEEVEQRVQDGVALALSAQLSARRTSRRLLRGGTYLQQFKELIGVEKSSAVLVCCIKRLANPLQL